MRKISVLAWSALAMSGVLGGACKSSEDDGMGGMGGESVGSGGVSATGGQGTSTGGKGNATGGATHSGGAGIGGGPANGGGPIYTGGSLTTGGSEATGGQSVGGEGGEASSGGASSTGGSGTGGTLPNTACADFPEAPSGNLGGAGSMGGAGSEEFVMASSSFDFCSAIPDDHTCAGKPFGSGSSPPLEWTEGPAGTQSYAIVFKDLSILERNTPGTFQYNRAYHWVIWDIPGNVLGLPEALPGGHFPPEVDGARQWGVRNNYGYLGSCPNSDPMASAEWNDSYSFTLYALPDAIVDVPAKDTTVNNWTRTMAEYLDTIALAKTELRGTSSARATEGPPQLGTLVYPCPTTGEATADCVSRPD